MIDTKTENIEQYLKKIYGHIYLARNCVNCKVYVGKVESHKTIEKRWSEHLREGRNLKESRKEAVSKKIFDSHLNNAIATYGQDVWEVKHIDNAYNEEELNEKEQYWIKAYDSENREKGYNMTKGGDGGKFRDELVEKLKNSIKAKWNDPEYRKRQSEGVKKKWQDPEYRKKQMEQTKIYTQNPDFKKRRSETSKQQWKDPAYRKRKVESVKKQWKSEEFRKKTLEAVLNGIKNKWQDPEFKKKQLQFPQYQKKPINNVKQFLEDIQAKTPTKAMEQKYNMHRRTISKRISELLKKYNVKNLSEARKFLEQKNIEKILKKY